MRKLMWTASLALGLGFAGTASAQSIVGYAGTPPTAAQTANSSPGVGLATYIRDTFSLTTIFAPFQFLAKVQTPTTASIPNPSSPAYLQAFGYQKLY